MHKVAGVTLLTALLAAAPSARADDDAATIVSQLVVAAKPRATALSGVTIEAKPKTTSVSGVEVAQPKKCLEPRTPPDPDVPAPQLVATYPTKGQVVAPGLLVVRLTFDLPMACRGSIGAVLAANPCASAGVQTWLLSYDRLNLRVLCKVTPGKSYDFWVNRHTPEDFQGLGGRKPTAYELTFQTSQEAPIATIPDAVARDPRPASPARAAAE